VARYHAGDLQTAESICRQILTQKPDEPMSMHLLGVIANDVKQYAIALELMERSALLRPGVPDFYNNLSVVYRNLDRLDDAVAAGREAIRIDPRRYSAYKQHGHRPGHARASGRSAGLFRGNRSRSTRAFPRARQPGPHPAHAGRLQEGLAEQEWRGRSTTSTRPSETSASRPGVERT